MNFFMFAPLWFFPVGASGFGKYDVSAVSVMEGDSVTLHTDAQTNQHQKIKWFFSNTRIAQIIANVSNCTDFQCEDSDERFRGRLKLDHQTGSLTIMNTSSLDCGYYTLELFISSSDVSDKIFNISVCGVSAAERDKRKRKRSANEEPVTSDPGAEMDKMKSVKEGESVTLVTCVTKNPNDVMKWYFNKILITEITGDQSKICTDDQCDERFRDRLKLDHQTGSLTIMNTTTEHAGVYRLKIFSNSSSINRILAILTVTAVPDSGLSAGVVAGIVVVVLLLVSAASVSAVIYYRKRHTAKQERPQPNEQVDPGLLLNQNDVQR